MVKMIYGNVICNMCNMMDLFEIPYNIFIHAWFINNVMQTPVLKTLPPQYHAHLVACVRSLFQLNKIMLVEFFKI